ncbi:MAG: FAD:protein FMN transferase [Planctomycetes bacterium]|nr:FAD:protein FMN transferase [Planctomycetota bacterium]
MNVHAAAKAALLLALAACASPPPSPPAAAPAAAPPLSRFSFTAVHFGNIPVELCLYAPDAATAQAAAAAAFARIAALAAMMNDYAYEPPSPLNRIAAEAPAPVPVPSELLSVLARAIELHHITQGAFDITLKPYVQLWRVSRRLGELPPQEHLRAAVRYVDITALQLDAAASTARLAREGMWLDVGGIAKGYVGDEVLRLLRARGLPRCSYHAGGDMVFGEAPPGEPGWPVLVPDFPTADGTGLRFVASNEAVSVSGDVFRFVEIDGRRYAHVIDPRTGLGVTDRRLTCVRGPRGLDTDALATAGLLLDEAAWQAALAQVPGCRGQVARARQESEVPGQ